MSKKSFVLMSLVGAIPGGVLTAVLVMMFLKHAGNTQGMMLALAGVTLVPSFALVLIPFAIVVFAPKDEKPEADEESTADEAEFEESAASDDEVVGFGDEIPDDFEADESMDSLSPSNAADDDFAAEMESMTASDSDFDDGGGEEFDDEMKSMAAAGESEPIAEDLNETFVEDGAGELDGEFSEDDDFELELEEDED